MRIKTLVIIFVTILLTAVIMQNNQEVKFTFLFLQFYLSNLIVMAAIALVSFLLGLAIARPRRIRIDTENYHSSSEEKRSPNTLSDEDRDYIN